MKKPTLLRRKRSEPTFITSTTPSDQRSEEGTGAPYNSPKFGMLLEMQASSYMKQDQLGIKDTCKSLCQMLLEKEQPIPKDSLFRDDKTFEMFCAKLQGKNEAGIFKDLTPLIIPYAEPLAMLGAKHLDVLVESVNEGWNNCIAVTRPRPQPDYSVGFGRSAFSDDQLGKLTPFIGDFSYVSYFAATYFMYFPFFTCEVKCCSTGLEIADRQNAHSMTVAIRGVVELFRGVGREQEIDREILGFSLSHDHESVRIWGHYPVMNGTKATFWRHPIRSFYFTEQNGKERWTAYTFTKNIYDIWMPIHFKRLSSAINDLPSEQDLQPTQQSELQIFERSGLSQQFGSQISTQEPGEKDSEPSQGALQPITPDTSTATASKKIKT